ncbi:hypothetical protein [Mycobacterium sp. SMC-4]|uniref:hypothetical protein n=1 Tax=Mycobacterium sp. SMC-4 TaxID=2857059 RepID=UPI003D070A27
MTGNEPQGAESAINYIPVSLSGGTASDIADLVSIMGDLEFARNCAAGYLQRLGKAGEENELLARALWTACCISYRRVFTTGKGHLEPGKPRLKLKPTWTDNLTPHQLAAHESVLDTANKHVAHRVSDLEQVLVQGLLAPPPLPREMVGVAAPILHMVGATQQEAEQLISVCDLLLNVSDQQWSLLVDEIKVHFNKNIDPLYEKVEAQQDDNVGT